MILYMHIYIQKIIALINMYDIKDKQQWELL